MLALLVQRMIVYTILQCARGHVVCSDCRPNVSTCPQVRQKSICPEVSQNVRGVTFFLLACIELSNRGIRQTTELFSRRDDSFSERTEFLQHKKTEFQSRRVSYNTTQINTRTDEARITRRLQIHIRCFCNTSTSQGSFLIA